MEWQIYGRIKEALERSDEGAALQLIEESRGETSSIAADVAVLEAECHQRRGAHDKALSVLEAALQSARPNFWSYYAIAKAYREQGRNEDCVRAYRKAHALIGWEESERNGYTFLQDYFSPNIPVWTEWFASRITAQSMQALEIGSWQGGSATWLLACAKRPWERINTRICLLNGWLKNSNQSRMPVGIPFSKSCLLYKMTPRRRCRLRSLTFPRLRFPQFPPILTLISTCERGGTPGPVSFTTTPPSSMSQRSSGWRSIS